MQSDRHHHQLLAVGVFIMSIAYLLVGLNLGVIMERMRNPKPIRIFIEPPREDQIKITPSKVNLSLWAKTDKYE